ncbi:Methyltransferase domain-containing protein [Marinospirillum celere]|uniref:Methyltransferase domain-containing protein n=1 Tax=Marinospirillum celere TaxID=1122252 RepID=A0A1I1EEJ9_9GAMM|nr:methyltransferase domain-containing protein [Marinospirillum celere]SFB85594.1 Methyltransferase domain-containing protein [Marinospirillum celere]
MSVQSQQAQLNQQVWQAWQTFWASTLGQEVLATETRMLKPLLENARGYHLLLLGSLPGEAILKDAGIRHHLEWRPSLEVAEKDSCLIADPAALPLPDDSMDLVILQHSLELFARPHALLKEAARVTLAKGELILIGFNPVSLWGLARMLPAFMQAEPLRNLKQADLISQAKLADWLEFLDLKKESEQQLFHRPPCNRLRIQQKLRSWDERLDNKDWPLAGIYLLRIKKRIGSPLRPIPAWKKTGWLPLQPVSSPTRNSLKNR